MHTRPSWDETLMEIARVWARRGTCDRAQVGAVAVDHRHHMLSAGYNGAAVGEPHCDDVGHDLVGGHCVRTLHAEENLVLHATQSLAGARVYCTHHPCWPCFRRLAEKGVIEIVYATPYGRSDDYLRIQGLATRRDIVIRPYRGGEA